MEMENFSKKSLMLIAGLTALFLLPFINKAFHIDDTLFLWCAKQIQSHPFDFFGFSANWDGSDSPMYLINQNPPLASYYIALVAFFFGWSETALHVAYLIPAVCLSTGTYLLALIFCPVASLAALIAVATPVFIVSATNVMCDIMMVAFYVWAAVFWLHGLEKNKPSYLFVSSLLISLSVLTKYFGMSMVPLLFVYTVMKQKRLDARLIFLVIPISVLAGYQWLSLTLYGTSLLSNAASYAIEWGASDSRFMILTKTMIGLSFCGGCGVIVLFYSAMLWSRFYLFFGGIMLTFLTAAFVFMDAYSGNPMIDIPSTPVTVIIHFFLFVLTGSQILILAFTDAWKNRDSKSILLFLWVTGTFLFASHVNWTINARTMLPMIPAVGILVTRRLNNRYKLPLPKNFTRFIWPLIPGIIIALAVSWSDASMADCQRKIARYFHTGLKDYRNTVWFQGHWGFQYYMQLYDAQALDFQNSKLRTGDIIVVPRTNIGQRVLPPDQYTFVKKLECTPLKWVGTVSKENRAGFYFDSKGKLFLPYGFGKVAKEEYYVFIVGQFKEPEKLIKKLKGEI